MSPKTKDPNAPKRAVSAYLFFSKSAREDALKEAGKDASLGEVQKIIAARWNKLDADGRKKYEAMAAKDKARYAKEMAKYEPPSEEEEEAPKKKRAKKDPNAPKRPLSAYFIFSNEARADVKKSNPEATLGEVAKILGGMWRDMSDSDKKKYNDEANVLKSKYEKAMKAYKA